MQNSRRLKLNKVFALLLSILFVFAMISAVSAARVEGDVTCPDYSFTASGGTVTKESSLGLTTLIVFVQADSSESQQVVQSLAKADWINWSKLKVRAVFFNGEEQTVIDQFITSYGAGNANITYCKGTVNDITNFYTAAGIEGGRVQSPVSVLVGADGKIKDVTQGAFVEDGLKTILAETGEDVVLPKPVEVLVTGKYGYSEAFELLELINAERASLGKAPLKMNKSLLDAAMQRALERRVYISDKRPDGTEITTLVTDCTILSEKAFDSSLNGAFSAINAEISSDEYTNIGIGVFEKDDVMSWAVLFSSNCSSAEAAKTESEEKTASVKILESNIAALKMEIPKLDKGNSGVIKTYMKANGARAGVLLDNECLLYESDNLDVATVTENGEITAISAGNAVITVRIKSSFVTGEVVLAVALPNGNTSSTEDTSSVDNNSSQQSSSQMTSSDNASSENTSSEATSSENVSSNNTSSDSTSSDDASSQATSSENTSSEATSSENVSSNNTSSDSTSSGVASSENVSSNNTASENNSSDNNSSSAEVSSRPIVNTSSKEPSRPQSGDNPSDTDSSSEETSSELTPSSSEVEMSSETENTPVIVPGDGDDPQGGKKGNALYIILAVAVVLLLAAGGVVFWFYLKKKNQNEETIEETAEEPEGFILTQDEESENE